MTAAAARLWSWQLSPFAGKVRAAFAEKGLAVELAEIHPVQRPARLRELNPLAKVPTLELADGSALRESSVICEWLEEVHPEPPLWPADPALRGWARGTVVWLDAELLVPFFLGFRKAAWPAPEDPDDIVERLHGRLARRWGMLEDQLGAHDGRWLCGEQLTYADLSGLPLAVRLPAWGPQLAPDAAAFPRTTAWLEALRARPSAAAIDARGPEVLRG